MKSSLRDFSGAWSASPTPLTADLRLDTASLRRAIDHQAKLGIKGLLFGGTCGEGPLLPRQLIGQLVNSAAKANRNRMILSAQVTDNSYRRVLENITAVRDAGADLAVVAEPWFRLPLVKPSFYETYYNEILDHTTLPVVIYIREILLSLPAYRKILMHPNVVLVKDSTLNPQIQKLVVAARKKRNDLTILTGGEFTIPDYLRAGYDGALAGGGILIGSLINDIILAAKENNWPLADKYQEQCKKILITVYGGKTFRCFLNGLKYTLTKISLFNSPACIAQYPFPKSVAQKIDAMIKKEKQTLFPYKKW